MKFLKNNLTLDLHEMNIKFSYIYRDAGNYKKYNQLVFANPNGIVLKEVQIRIKSCLIDECWFRAYDWKVPDLHFKEYEWDSLTDHNWHEVESIEETNDLATEEGTIDDFLIKIKILNNLVTNKLSE